MAKWFFGIWLGVQLICRRIDLDADLFFMLWQNQPAIEIYEANPAVRRAHLSRRLDAIFPF